MKTAQVFAISLGVVGCAMIGAGDTATATATRIDTAAGSVNAAMAVPQSARGTELGPVLAGLEGRWTGEGELLDRPARFSMAWARALDGKYLRLEFGNAFTDVDPPEGILEAHAYYLLGAPSLAGRWIDSRGVMLSIEAEIVDNSLVATWRGEESGRTEYTVIDENTVEVVDYVLTDGRYFAFANARYRRVD